MRSPQPRGRAGLTSRPGPSSRTPPSTESCRRSLRVPGWMSPSSPSSNGPSSDRPGAHFVDDLAPYIERKLFTVNTGHAAAAYLGARAGHVTIAQTLADPSIAGQVIAALEETSALLTAKHELPVEELADYRATILRRFQNPALPDTVGRVGRQPLRKLSRHDGVGTARGCRCCPGVRRPRRPAVPGAAAAASRNGCRRRRDSDHGPDTPASAVCRPSRGRPRPPAPAVSRSQLLNIAGKPRVRGAAAAPQTRIRGVGCGPVS